MGTSFGTGTTAGALALSLTEWTSSARVVAINGLLQAIPSIAVLWAAGSVVDRFDRSLTMSIASYARAAVVLTLVLSGPDRIWLVFVTTVAQSAIGAFFDPANAALIPRIVRSQRRAAANGLLASSGMLASLLGLSVAGFLVGAASRPWAAFFVSSLAFATAGSLASRIRRRGDDDSACGAPGTAFSGFRIIAGSRLLIGTVVGTSLAIVGFGVVNVTMAPLVLNELEISPTWYGTINAAFVVSAITIGFTCGRIARRLAPTRMVTAGLALFATGIAGVAVAHHAIALGCALVICGIAQPVLGTGGQLITQESVSDDHRGRVMSIAFTSYRIAEVTGITAVAVLVESTGVRPLLGGAAVVLALSWAATMLLFRPEV